MRIKSMLYKCILILIIATACVPTSRVSLPRVLDKGSSYFGIGGELIFLTNPDVITLEDYASDPNESITSSIATFGYGITDKIEIQMQSIGATANMSIKYQLVDGMIPITASHGFGANLISFESDSRSFIKSQFNDISIGYKYAYLSPKVIYNFSSPFFKSKWNYGFTAGLTNQNLSKSDFWQKGIVMNAEYAFFYLGDFNYHSLMMTFLLPIKW